MRMVGYGRVSTDKEEQLDSLEHQKMFFGQFALQHGHELVHVYADEGISGKALKNREDFKKMISDASLHIFDIVVVKDISRFARNTVDMLTSVRQLKSLGIEVLFLSNNMSILGQSEFVLTIFGALAQEESANLSKRVKFGKRITAENGRVPNSVFGYDHINKYEMSINPEEADVVRLAFDLYGNQMYGTRRVAVELNARGFTTKQGAEWNCTNVKRMLTNSLYCGEYVNHKYEVKDFIEGKLTKVPDSEQLHHNRPEWAIVSRELFDKTQKRLSYRREQYSTHSDHVRDRYGDKYPFSTLIHCAECGRSFRRRSYTYTKTYVYWKCPTNDQYTSKKCPNGNNVREDMLYKKINEALSNLIDNEESFINGIVDDFVTQGTGVSKQRDFVAELAALQKKQDKYKEMYVNDVISMTDLKARLNSIKTKTEELTSLELAERVNVRDDALIQHERQRYIETVRELLKCESWTNQQMRQLIDDIVVSVDGTVTVKLKDFTK